MSKQSISGGSSHSSNATGSQSDPTTINHDPFTLEAAIDSLR